MLKARLKTITLYGGASSKHQGGGGDSYCCDRDKTFTSLNIV